MGHIRLTGLVVVMMLGVLVAPAQAWWCYGHMVISKIAQKLMPTEVFNYFNTGIIYNAQHFINVDDMTQQACWLDDQNAYNQGRSESWHFYNQCYNPDGTTCPPPQTKIELPVSLKLARDNLLQWSSLDAQGQAYWTAVLIHLTGDSHQPLHVCQLVSQQFPNGDRGGNEFPIVYNGSTLKLHMFYDMIGGEFPKAGHRPSSKYPSSGTEVDQFASYLLNSISIPSSMQTDLNFADWFAEGLTLCGWAYQNGNLQTGDTLTNSYVTQTRLKLFPRLVTAGYRLSNLFQYIYNQTSLQAKK